MATPASVALSELSMSTTCAALSLATTAGAFVALSSMESARIDTYPA